MGLEYTQLFLIVFLTHPGVIIRSSSIESIGLPFKPPEIPIALAGLWQVLWVWILSKPAERSLAGGWTLFTLELIFLGIYLYLFATSPGCPKS